MAEWNDENKAQLLADYLAEEPTPETSIEIVKQLAENYDATPNGVISILVRTGKYVKKAPATKASTSGTGDKKKESKAESLNRLTKAIEAQGLEADGDITGKLTGKAAAYFADIITKIVEEDEVE